MTKREVVKRVRRNVQVRLLATIVWVWSYIPSDLVFKARPPV